MTKKKLNPSLLVEDSDLYPRVKVDDTIVSRYADHYRSDVEFPLPVVCADSLRIVDGWHRIRAWKTVYGDEPIQVELEKFESDGDRFRRATTLNAGHGRPLSSQDKVRIAQKGLRFGIEFGESAVLLHTSTASLKTLVINRTAKSQSVVITGSKRPRLTADDVILKPAFRHKAGKTLSNKQQAANSYFAGASLTYLTKQLNVAIEADMLPDQTADPGLYEQLSILFARLAEIQLPELVT